MDGDRLNLPRQREVCIRCRRASETFAIKVIKVLESSRPRRRHSPGRDDRAQVSQGSRSEVINFRGNRVPPGPSDSPIPHVHMATLCLCL